MVSSLLIIAGALRERMWRALALRENAATGRPLFLFYLLLLGGSLFLGCNGPGAG